MNKPLSVFWFRRDLRLEDNAGLYHALKNGGSVLPLFIFDRHILDDLKDRSDARVSFIYQTMLALKAQLEARGGSLLCYYDTPKNAWERLLNQYPVKAVYTNRDYEPYAVERDDQVAALLAQKGIPFLTYKDHVIFEKDEVVKDNGGPYTVFTPYSKKWLHRLHSGVDQAGEPSSYVKPYPSVDYLDQLAPMAPLPFLELESMGFRSSELTIPPTVVGQNIIKNYDKTRNFPAINGTSRLGIHFRFGTISIREKAQKALGLNATYLNELIWRDFYSQILAHFPQVTQRAFNAKYDAIPWREAPEELELWKAGKTGYPIVDAGMRELAATGYMHNRVRMITASFLTKHLLIDWRLGEAWFAEKLLDYDLASNSGGWQWAAGCGTDAAPYFRIFNPTEQAKKFDPDYKYIRKWVPEFGTPSYPQPIVEHRFARERCLETYKKALNS